MFLEKLQENNKRLVEYAFDAHQKGLVLPDTYILDLDMIAANGKAMVLEAKQHGIKLFFMLKQIGRNPIVAKKLMEVGFDGCVAVDYKEALTMIDAGIHLGNVGHLVQVPVATLEKIIAAKPDVITVYDSEKIMQINEVAKKLNVVQPLMIRITDDDSDLYSGQIGGFKSQDLESTIKLIEMLDNVSVGGLTVFPALLYDADSVSIIPTVNMKAMERAKLIAEELGYKDILINIPSATCCASMKTINKIGGNNGEPGHGLTGTTPLHKVTDQPEKVAYVYVSEISHNYNDKSYCYGGGHYRRGHMENVFVGTSLEDCVKAKVVAPDNDSIDYHYELNKHFKPGLSAIMCYRTQIFTTRSQVAIVEGLSTGSPVITGIYDSLGKEVDVNWR